MALSAPIGFIHTLRKYQKHWTILELMWVDYVGMMMWDMPSVGLMFRVVGLGTWSLEFKS